MCLNRPAAGVVAQVGRAQGGFVQVGFERFRVIDSMTMSASKVGGAKGNQQARVEAWRFLRREFWVQELNDFGGTRNWPPECPSSFSTTRKRLLEHDRVGSSAFAANCRPEASASTADLRIPRRLPTGIPSDVRSGRSWPAAGRCAFSRQSAY
jgi:hypothetical protein